MDNPRPTLAKLATLSHNRTFTRKEWSEYGGTDAEWHWLRSRDLITNDGRQWYPTTLGWSMIDGCV